MEKSWNYVFEFLWEPCISDRQTKKRLACTSLQFNPSLSSENSKCIAIHAKYKLSRFEVVFVFVWLDFLRPSQQFSVMLGWVVTK